MCLQSVAATRGTGVSRKKTKVQATFVPANGQATDSLPWAVKRSWAARRRQCSEIKRWKHNCLVAFHRHQISYVVRDLCLKDRQGIIILGPMRTLQCDFSQ